MAKNGDISRIAITTPMKIHGFEQIIYEQNEYSYDNDDSISKWIVLSLFLLIRLFEFFFFFHFSEQFNYIYFGPKSGEGQSVPFIVIPHGGPHSNFANTFSLESSFLALAGNR